MIRAIDTFWNGRMYRSRLEARWAIFFDRMGLAVEYEHEGFQFDGDRYLPDFCAVESGLFIEIKPRYVLVDNTVELRRARIRQSLMEVSGVHIVNVFGNPPHGEHGVEIPKAPDALMRFAECRECGGLSLCCDFYGWSEWPHKCAVDGERAPLFGGERITAAANEAMMERFDGRKP